jgi:nucleoid DNA-binding protein
MTKGEVVAALARRTGMPRKDAAEAVGLFLDAVRKALERGEKVSLLGFGTFYVKERNPRQGRNPRTGSQIQIPRKRVATFRPGRAFRQLINTENTPTAN